jgi:Fic family protein
LISDFLSKNTQESLEEGLRLLNICRPISPSVLQKIREEFQIEMTYNSNAIEGNSLTLKETFWVIQEGLTIKEKPLKDHLEAKNHKEALDFLYDLIDSKDKHIISERLIKELHQLVVRDSQRDIAGKYRDGDVIISGSDHKPPSYFELKERMDELMKWMQKHYKTMHRIEFAALLHHQLAHIHPFWDGNGRTSRLMMNVFIMQAGYPIAIILKNDRKRYYRVLSLADEGNYKPLCEFIAQAVLRSLHIYIKRLQPPKDKNAQFISLRELAENEDIPYSATYLRKMATQGRIEAFKEGRNWLSSKKAILKYIDSL